MGSNGQDNVLVQKETEIYHPRMGEQLSTPQQEDLRTLLSDFEDIKQDHPDRTKLSSHDIITNSARPVRLHPHHIPHTLRDAVKEEMPEEGITEP